MIVLQRDSAAVHRKLNGKQSRSWKESIGTRPVCSYHMCKKKQQQQKGFVHSCAKIAALYSTFANDEFTARHHDDVTPKYLPSRFAPVKFGFRVAVGSNPFLAYRNCNDARVQNDPSLTDEMFTLSIYITRKRPSRKPKRDRNPANRGDATQRFQNEGKKNITFDH